MRLRFLGLLAVAVALAKVSARECRDDLNEAEGYTIRSVTIEGRWVPPIALPIKPGDRYSNAGIQQAMRAVQEALRSEKSKQFELQDLGAIGVTHITRCLLVEGHDVDVIIQPRSVRIDLFEVGGNVLPIPRSPFATFYDAVPRPILALNPTFGAYEDKKYGFAPTAAIGANLLDLDPLKRDLAAARAARLDLFASGRKSVEHSFYNADATLAYSTSHFGEIVEQLSLDAGYHGLDSPRGDGTFERQSGELGATVRLRPGSSPLLATLDLGAHYRYSENRFAQPGPNEDTSENAFAFRLLAEGKAGGAFLRAAMWADVGLPNQGNTYGRIAGAFALEKEFLIAMNQTIGLEASLGGGKAWSAPAYAEFYGGNSNRNFLYDAANSAALTAFPVGPVIRSLGEGQSQAQGSSAYWYLNFNVTLPIPFLSRPLIPNEEVAPGLTLKRLLKNKASDSIAFYAEELEEEGLSPDAALAKAQQTYGEVRPTIEFIADRANVYSLKPILLCDVAGQEVSGGHHVQAALGGGLQLTIVTAKMEAGYMQSVAGVPGDSGNFFARIVFENIF